MRSAPEIRVLTGLRAFPALLVVFYHFYREHIPAAVPVVSDLVDGGFVAVGMFFVLSGFVLTYSYAGVSLDEPDSRRRFFRARFARVYPVYFLSLVVAFLARLPDSATEAATWKGLRHIALTVPLLNAFSRYGMFYLNWAAWSLSAEAFFYLLFPWIHALLRRRSERVLACVGVLAWLFGLVAPTLYTVLAPDHLGRPLAAHDEVLWSWYLKFYPVTHLGSFVIGVVAGLLFLRRRTPHQDARVGASWRPGFAFAASVLFVVELLCTERVPFVYLTTDVLAPVFAVLVAAVATMDGTRSFVARALQLAPVMLLGRASYAVYILHVPIFYVFFHFLPQMWDSAPLFWPYLGALLVASVAVYRFVEEPARRALTLGYAQRRAPPPLGEAIAGD
jgi:peptidoglycan/LPS O-acetylase OafA/YrhL